MDITKILKQINLGEVQQQGEDIRKKMEEITVVGESGGGMVCIKMNGLGNALSADIDDSLLDASHKKTLCDLLVAAVNIAREKVAEALKDAALSNVMNMSSLFGSGK